MHEVIWSNSHVKLIIAAASTSHSGVGSLLSNVTRYDGHQCWNIDDIKKQWGPLIATAVWTDGDSNYSKHLRQHVRSGGRNTGGRNETLLGEKLWVCRLSRETLASFKWLPPTTGDWDECRHQSRGFKLKFHTFCSLLGGVKLLLCRPSKSRRVKQNGSLLPAGDTATKSVWRRIKIMQPALLFLFVFLVVSAPADVASSHWASGTANRAFNWRHPYSARWLLCKTSLASQSYSSAQAGFLQQMHWICWSSCS